MSLKCFLLLEGTLEGAGPGDAVTVGGSEGHHGARVMRLRAGEQILLTDTTGRQVAGSITAVDKASFTVTLGEGPTLAAPRVPRLVLVQALAKGGRDEAAIETATELGVDGIIPWQADRSVVQWRGEKQTKGVAKWRATVQAAVKQSRRASIPEITEPVTSSKLAAEVRAASQAGSLVLALHESAPHGLSAHLRELASLDLPDAAPGEGTLPPEVWVIVGPEGGISDDEATTLEASGAHLTLLGPEILRASSAGPAAIAALCGALGRWS